jgi:FKBP-type peptidyl-prolyl cis-trans isomerase FklB
MHFFPLSLMTSRVGRRSIAVWVLTLGTFLSAAVAFAADSELTPAASQAFLASHAKNPAVTVRPSGLQYRILKYGFGRHAGPRDTVQLSYTARLINGVVVDGTSPGLPASVAVNGATPGLSEALQLMREGDHWELTVPPNLAFGDKGGANGVVPPGQAVIFDVTLLSASSPVANAEGPKDGLSIDASAREQGAHWTIHQ